MSELGAAARRYAERGIPVFPLHGIKVNAAGVGCTCPKGPTCERPGKHPQTRDGFHAATTDLELVEKWWRTTPTANIGAVTGERFDVLDLDTVDVDLEGFGTRCARTATGRGHVFYKPTGLLRRIGIAEATDWLGTGGYVVLPPSRGIAGVYEFVNDLPLADAPTQLLELLRRSHTPPRRRAPSTVPAGRWNCSGLVDTMRRAAEGTRNQTLFWCACRAQSDHVEGKCSDAELAAALDAIADAAFEAGLAGDEIARTIFSTERSCAT